MPEYLPVVAVLVIVIIAVEWLWLGRPKASRLPICESLVVEVKDFKRVGRRSYFTGRLAPDKPWRMYFVDECEHQPHFPLGGKFVVVLRRGGTVSYSSHEYDPRRGGVASLVS